MYQKVLVWIFVCMISSLAGCTSTTPPDNHTNSLSSWVEEITWPGYTLEDVAKHNTNDECRSAINNNVYDLTHYISQHPGGSKRIESLCGQDSSAIYNTEHWNKYRPEQALQKLQIGTIITWWSSL